jgi:hypothetical protein
MAGSDPLEFFGYRVWHCFSASLISLANYGLWSGHDECLGKAGDERYSSGMIIPQAAGQVMISGCNCEATSNVVKETAKFTMESQNHGFLA